MSDLFTPEANAQATKLELPGGDLLFQGGFLSRMDADQLFATLLVDTAWEERDVFVWGKWHKQPRLVAWHGDTNAVYSYSGSTMTPAPWTPALQRVRGLVEATSGARFNSVLLNLYRDHNDRMGWHSDKEPELGPAPTIASVSFGATRELQFKSRHDKALGTLKIALTHGSLLVMAGATQLNWVHGINRESTSQGKRINLTFRLIKAAAGKE